ncbi:hypothetical protein N657DRAFT_577590, partial [Parathielavia appendiculata]
IMEPGTYIAIAQIAFQGACVAVKAFRNGLSFSQDAERLVLGLEVERFRLHIWGENAGLAPPEGQPVTLPNRLLPICEILKDYLEQIERLVKDADDLTNRYGLLPTQEAPTKSALVRQLVDRMQRSIQSSKVKLAAVGATEDEEDEEQKKEAESGHLVAQAAAGQDDVGLSSPRRTTSTWKKIRWAVRDLEKFECLVKDLGHRINKLNDLLTEAQQRKTREDNYRVNMVVVGSAVDEASLELIRAAVRGEPDTSQVRAAVERKALTVGQGMTTESTQTQRAPLSLDMFFLPNNFGSKEFASVKHFVTVKRSDSASNPSYYLLERKPFDPSILDADKDRLASRIQRLVLLLQRPKSPDFRTPKAEGCIHDPGNSCWWIAFQYPLHVDPPTLGKTPDSTHIATRRLLLSKPKDTPVSLLTLLAPSAKFRPPLEQRLALASAFCTTLSELYLSGWLHKSIRSENILFPHAGAVLHPPPYSYAPEQMQAILSTPLVCGFDYTRHESEWATVDRARTRGQVAAAIYRHPDYQGEAAEGYKVQYDAYSVGLVLVEIAVWMPLKEKFLEATKKSLSSSSASSASASALGSDFAPQSSRATSSGVELSGDMDVFHAPHAVELKRRVIHVVESELAFRVGSLYYRAVKFCLEFADRQPDPGVADGGEVGVHPAMAFYDNVVVPLAGLVQ